MPLKVLVFGATGSAGGSVLGVCLASADVQEVRAIVRRPLGLTSAKLREVVHDDYQDFTRVSSAFENVDACFYCLGKSVRQVSGEVEYRRITYDFAVAVASALRTESPSALFHFISGQGASLSSRFMWARVKAETERDLIARFGAVCWRPAAIDGVRSESEPTLYKAIRPLARLVLKPFQSLYVTGEDIGRAMLLATAEGYRGRIIENAEIRRIAHHWAALETRNAARSTATPRR